MIQRFVLVMFKLPRLSLALTEWISPLACQYLLIPMVSLELAP
jgi:hypothetical protein